MIGREITSGFVELLTVIVVLAIVALIISNNSKTADIISKAGKFFSSVIKVTVSPIKGTSI